MCLSGTLRGIVPAEIICRINAREIRNKRAMVKVGVNKRQSLTEAYINRDSSKINLEHRGR